MSSYALFDTSVLIDQERGASNPALDGLSWAVSAMTFSELSIGVLLASNARDRQRCVTTLMAVGDAPVLPFDETVARTHAELTAWASGEGYRPGVADGIIAATAATHGLKLVTLDRGFEQLAGFEGLDVLVL